MDTTKLPKYNSILSCPKCLHHWNEPQHNSTELIINKELQSDGGFLDMRAVSDPNFECLARRCGNCNFLWLEQCADTKAGSSVKAAPKR